MEELPLGDEKEECVCLTTTDKVFSEESFYKESQMVVIIYLKIVIGKKVMQDVLQYTLGGNIVAG